MSSQAISECEIAQRIYKHQLEEEGNLTGPASTEKKNRAKTGDVHVETKELNKHQQELSFLCRVPSVASADFEDK